jgi:threonine/homoserine/homoserine lactone efflux protein
VLAWGCFAALGIAAVLATSAAVFDAVKLVGAVALVLIGLRSIRSKREPETVAASGRSALRTGLLTGV